MCGRNLLRVQVSQRFQHPFLLTPGDPAPFLSALRSDFLMVYLWLFAILAHDSPFLIFLHCSKAFFLQYLLLHPIIRFEMTRDTSANGSNMPLLYAAV